MDEHPAIPDLLMSKIEIRWLLTHGQLSLKNQRKHIRKSEEFTITSVKVKFSKESEAQLEVRLENRLVVTLLVFVSVVWSLRHEICSRLDLEEGRTDCSTSWLTEGMRYHADWGDSEACQGTDGEDGEINKEEGS